MTLVLALGAFDPMKDASRDLKKIPGLFIGELVRLIVQRFEETSMLGENHGKVFLVGSCLANDN